MSERTSYRCDVCNIEKQTANHWWKGYLVVSPEGAIPDGVMILPWKAEYLTESGTPIKPKAHLCGEAHAIEWASKNLAKK